MVQAIEICLYEMMQQSHKVAVLEDTIFHFTDTLFPADIRHSPGSGMEYSARKIALNRFSLQLPLLLVGSPWLPDFSIK
jgi:hypothetical protein